MQVLYGALAHAEVARSTVPTFRVTFDDVTHLPTSIAVSESFLRLFYVTFSGFMGLIARQSALGYADGWQARNSGCDPRPFPSAASSTMNRCSRALRHMVHPSVRG